jgi:hypothetical protein
VDSSNIHPYQSIELFKLGRTREKEDSASHPFNLHIPGPRTIPTVPAAVNPTILFLNPEMSIFFQETLPNHTLQRIRYSGMSNACRSKNPVTALKLFNAHLVSPTTALAEQGLVLRAADFVRARAPAAASPIRGTGMTFTGYAGLDCDCEFFVHLVFQGGFERQ